MLTKAGCEERRTRLWAEVPDSCDVLIINSPEHLTYLCGYWPSPFTFRTNEAGAALVLTRDRAVLVGDNLLRPFLEDAFVDEVVAPVWYEGRKSAVPRRNLLASVIAAHIAALRPRSLGFEHATIPAGVVDRVRDDCSTREQTDVGPILVRLRRAKAADEIDLLREAIHTGCAAMDHVSTIFRGGTKHTELTLQLAIEAACRARQGEAVWVYGDFAAGTRARGPNTLASRYQLSDGDMIILDFSVVLRGYRCDIANTLILGEPNSRQQATFDACLAALELGEMRLKPGVTCRAIDAAIRGELMRHGFDASQRGHMGHGIGVGHPEAPFLVPESDDVLAPGDVVTLEPSLFPDDLNGGVRLERNYHVTQKGFECLSDHTLTLGRIAT